MEERIQRLILDINNLTVIGKLTWGVIYLQSAEKFTRMTEAYKTKFKNKIIIIDHRGNLYIRKRFLLLFSYEEFICRSPVLAELYDRLKVEKSNLSKEIDSNNSAKKLNCFLNEMGY